ncbi:MAG: hypothetical protein R2867_23890 [Caldilineaceae bacterium]
MAGFFGVGMLMVMTPGKAGEFLKSYMVKNVTGTPMAVTAPVVLAEHDRWRSYLLLASVGLFAYPDPKALDRGHCFPKFSAQRLSSFRFDHWRCVCSGGASICRWCIALPITYIASMRAVI